MPHHRYRVLALDVDGTLLDGEGRPRPQTIEAVHRAARAGIRPVLCTGRRYRRALPIAEQLGIDSPLVCNSGALVKEPRGHRTLWRADLPGRIVKDILELFRLRDELAVSFTDRPLGDFDFIVGEARSGRPLFDDYLDQNRSHAEVAPGWTTRADLNHYHLCAIGTKPTMLDLQGAILERTSGSVQTFVQRSPKYAGTMCEVLRHDANKWAALLQVARLWDVGPAEICAVGDDMNDVPMLRGAGLGVAMGHSSPEVIDAADLVTGSDREDGVAMFIDDVLLA